MSSCEPAEWFNQAVTSTNWIHSQKRSVKFLGRNEPSYKASCKQTHPLLQYRRRRLIREKPVQGQQEYLRCRLVLQDRDDTLKGYAATYQIGYPDKICLTYGDSTLPRKQAVQWASASFTAARNTKREMATTDSPVLSAATDPVASPLEGNAGQNFRDLP